MPAGLPAADEYFDFYAGYVRMVPETDPVPAMEAQGGITQSLLSGVSEERSLHRYAPGKWSIREVVGHLGDTERIMAYRALRIARGDAKPLQGFEENEYVRNASFDRRSLADLLAELADIRRTSLALFRGLEEACWNRRGTASGHEISVRALAFIIPGHERHHVRVLQDRYGIGGNR
ncbi:MAG: DinB family protein [Gemmatimonadota bacterium]